MREIQNRNKTIQKFIHLWEFVEKFRNQMKIKQNQSVSLNRKGIIGRVKGGIGTFY